MLFSVPLTKIMGLKIFIWGLAVKFAILSSNSAEFGVFPNFKEKHAPAPEWLLKTTPCGYLISRLLNCQCSEKRNRQSDQISPNHDVIKFVGKKRVLNEPSMAENGQQLYKTQCLLYFGKSTHKTTYTEENPFPKIKKMTKFYYKNV